MLMLCAIANGFAQNNYTLTGLFTNGQTIKENEIFFLNDSCTFNITNESGSIQELKTCKWEFKANLKDGNQFTVYNSDDSTFEFKIDSVLYKKTSLCWRFQRVTRVGDNSVYYSTLITCHAELANGQKINLETPVLLNLLPSVPTVKLLDITYSNYDSIYHIFDDGKMTLQFISDRSTKGYVYQINPLEHIYLVIQHDYIIKDGKQLVIFDFYDADAYLTFAAHNGNGGVEGYDTIKTWKHIPASITQSVNDETISFYPNPAKDILFINGNVDNISSVNICNSMGYLVKRVSHITHSFDISDLPNGIYLISYVDKKTQKSKVHKFIKA